MFLSKQFHLSLAFVNSVTHRAHDTLFDAIHPLLQAIGTYAGCHVSLIAGNAGADGTSDSFFTA